MGLFDTKNTISEEQHKAELQKLTDAHKAELKKTTDEKEAAEKKVTDLTSQVEGLEKKVEALENTPPKPEGGNGSEDTGNNGAETHEYDANASYNKFVDEHLSHPKED